MIRTDDVPEHPARGSRQKWTALCRAAELASRVQTADLEVRGCPESRATSYRQAPVASHHPQHHPASMQTPVSALPKLVNQNRANLIRNAGLHFDTHDLGEPTLKYLFFDCSQQIFSLVRGLDLEIRITCDAKRPAPKYLHTRK